MKKQPAGLKSTKNQSPPTTATKTDYGYNFSNQSNYKKFFKFLKESIDSSRKRRQNDKRIECNCWVCKILNSSSSSVVTNETKTAGKYEAYNIVSESAIKEIVNRIIDHQKKRLGPSINNKKRNEHKYW